MGLRDTFEQLALEHVESYISSGQEENLHLDFKTVADARLERDDRKNLAKAIAGFANSDGGLIVWGVATARNGGVEYATGLEPISPLSTFMAKLNQCTGEAANPTVHGVDHRKIVIRDDCGVAVTYVPPSDLGPHMAKCGEDRYYRRSGDRFSRMEHFDIADMFGRRPQPVLCVFHRLATGGRGGGPEGTFRDLTVFVGLRNDGRGLARAPYVALLPKPPYSIDRHGIDGNGQFGLDPLPRSEDSVWSRFGGGDGRYIYPGTQLDVAAIRLRVLESDSRVTTMRIDYEFAADGIPVEHGQARIDGYELVTAVWPDEDA
jgi:hypothetical protein